MEQVRINAHERSYKWRITLLPILTVISSGFACLVAYLVGVENGKVEAPPFVPYVSDTGSLKPQSSWFTLFLVISCYLTNNIIFVRYRQVAAKQKCPTANKISYFIGIVFVFGKLVVASFQLSSLKDIHYVGALVYFTGALIYAISQTYIQYRCSNLGLRLFILTPATAKAAIVFWTRIMCCFGLFICTIIFPCFALISSLKKYNRDGENVGQGTEWTMVMLKSVYMLTFLYDFWKIEITDIMHFPEDLQTDTTDRGNGFTGAAIIPETSQYNRFSCNQGSTLNMVKSADSEEEKKENAMRVGEEYQAEVPEMLKDVTLDRDHRPEPLLVWAPCDNVPENKMDEYLRVAKDKYGYNIEQALGMLYWHKYDVEKSSEDLRNFTPLPDEWSMEDQVIFEQSFSSYGKHFPRIRQQLPDKSIGTLVKYYYAWKKSRNKKSLMDKGEKRELAMINGIFAYDSNPDDSSDSDYEPVEKKTKANKNTDKAGNNSGNNAPTVVENKPSPMLSTNCVNCAGVTQQMHSTPRGKMCVPCYDYWRRTGIIRPRDKDNPISLYQAPQHKLKKKPPKGMSLNAEMLIDIAQTHGDSHIRPLEIELINLKRQLMTDKQILQDQSSHLSGKVEQFRPSQLTQKINPRWSNEELLIAVQCVRKYGKDFDAMAEILGNKNTTHCRNFFINHRRRFNLIEVLAEYEKENNIPRGESKLNEWDAAPEMEIVDPNYQPSSGHDQGNQHQSENGSNGPPPLVCSVPSVVVSAT